MASSGLVTINGHSHSYSWLPPCQLLAPGALEAWPLCLGAAELHQETMLVIIFFPQAPTGLASSRKIRALVVYRSTAHGFVQKWWYHVVPLNQP